MAGTVFYNVEKADIALENRDNLMAHIEYSMAKGFYIEAIVILHSMMENYTYKMLHILHIPYKASDRLFQCLEYLKQHVEEKDIQAGLKNIDDESIVIHLTEQLFESGLAKDIGKWRKERNLMIHDIAIEDLSKERFSIIAIEGKHLFEEYEKVLKNILCN